MSKKQKENSGARVLDVLLSVALLAGIGCGGAYVAAHTVRISQENRTLSSDQPETTEPPTEETGAIYDTSEFSNTMLYSSPLILVNDSYSCQIGEEGLVSLYEKKLEVDNHSFSVRDSSVQVQKEMADALIAMFDDFYAATYDDNIVVSSGYRSKDRQQELYDEDLEQTGLDYSERVAKPGYSEHQTGLGVDLGLVDGEDYTGDGVYKWINEHCADYGIVLRYPESKKDITNIQYEPWHYRYVGVPHAFFMKQNDLCLEEYIELLKQYPYEGEHLNVTNSDGKIYEIYFYPADTEYTSTMVPVPNGLDYTVCGNNADGFIVTVDTGTTGEPATSAPADSSTDADTSDTDADATEDTSETDTAADTDAGTDN